ncbi:MAG: DNA polymerase III subunit alpha, partial [Actinobacteria bacterium]|nr:DNA polymerase III subunit alpha [Actinomycetota bacterium]
VSYWTAYLKANFPAEYMAALLTSVRDDKDKSALYLNECRRMGIKVLPPDVNESDADFTPRDTDIRFGLAAVRNVGAGVVASIVGARNEKGRFAHFGDYLAKADAQACSKKTVESLIKAGAFDSLGHTRRGLMAVHMEAIDSVMENKRAEAIGQFDLFGAAGPAGSQTVGLDIEVPIDEWEKSLLLAYEREMLGLYVSDHPLLGVEHVLARQVDRSISSLASEDVAHEQIVSVGGLITAIQRKVSRKGDAWAIVTLEDLEGVIDVNFFSNAYNAHANSLVEDSIVIIRGRVDKREEQARLFAMEMTVPDISVGARGPLCVTMPVALCTQPNVERLKEILRTHPGTTDVQVRLESAGQSTLLKIEEGLRVRVTPSLSADLKALFGAGCLV